jgi:hypothetical protein
MAVGELATTLAVDADRAEDALPSSSAHERELFPVR